MPVKIETSDTVAKEVGVIRLQLAQGRRLGIAWGNFGAVVIDIATGAGLIGKPEHIWLVVAPVDVRRGIDGLSMIVLETLERHRV